MAGWLVYIHLRERELKLVERNGMVEENWWMEEKAREGSRFIGGFGKRAALCPGDVCCGTPRNKKTQARQGLSSSGRGLSWAIFASAHILRFAYFHQSLFLFESA